MKIYGESQSDTDVVIDDDGKKTTIECTQSVTFLIGVPGEKLAVVKVSRDIEAARWVTTVPQCYWLFTFISAGSVVEIDCPAGTPVVARYARGVL